MNINASDRAMRANVERYEGLALWAARVLLLGLALEIVLAAWSPLDKEVSRWSPVLATAVVALGVWGEVRFAKRASILQGELLKRSEWRLEVVLARTDWRSLEDGKLLTALQKYPPASLEIRYLSDDPETQAFAEDFILSFTANGWKVSWYIESYGEGMVAGIRVHGRTLEDWDVVNNVRSALTEAGIEFSTNPIPQAFQSTGPHGQPGASPQAILYVGPKPHIPA